MKISSFSLKTFTLAITMAVATSIGPALAEYPEKPVKIIVPFGAGDSLDGTARVIADQLKKELKIPFIVQNIPGAGGGKGTAEANKAAGDGYTLLMGSTGALTARPLISKPGYVTSDFVPLAQLVEVPIGLAVKADSRFKSVKDIIDAARANPGKIKYSTPGPGATQHINMEIFAKSQGVKMTHIGGRGGKGAVTKTLSGEVDFVFVGAPNYTSLVRGGKLRVVGVAASNRLPYFSNVPTFKEQGFDFTVAVWFGLLTNKGTPTAVVNQLRSIIKKVASNSATSAMYKRFNFVEAFLDGEGFQRQINANVAKHRVVLKDIGLMK
jgi:tripartite-type tricarboxylate transporter receptor subunit TctC